MHIKEFTVKNFKSFQEVTFHFNPDINILTGKNNTGKTTMLEALALWHECFEKLLHQAKRGEKNYRRGNWILGPTYNRYFPFDQVNSVRSPNFEDIFHQRDKRKPIFLGAILSGHDTRPLSVGFNIGQSGLNYVIGLDNFRQYNFATFNEFFDHLPNAMGLFYASPVSTVKQVEEFATDPQIRDVILRRESVNVLRNRLHKMLRGAATNLYALFKQDLSYALFNNQYTIEFDTPSDFNRDTRVIVNYELGKSDPIQKDVALLGSGSLQTIEILLNLHQPEMISVTRDFNIILLDEPDSHIHRDVQQRLMDVLNRRSLPPHNNQIFLSTHNESLIRSAVYHQLFHLEGKPNGTIKSIDKEQAAKIGSRFKGIYPSQITPIIRSIGAVTGLDFVNAMEADRLVFVEGEDDARVINLLLRPQIIKGKKYMFWVMGGVNEVFENIAAYKNVFSSIKNSKTLWERSVLLFDKDYLTTEHANAISSRLNEKLGLESYSWDAYTLESTVFSNLDLLAGLISLWVYESNGSHADRTALLTSFQKEYADFKPLLEQRQTPAFLEECCYRYKNIREKTNQLFGRPSIITQNDIQLRTLIEKHFQLSLDAGKFFQLMNKDDVGQVIDKVVQPFGLSFSIETDFIEIIKLVNTSLWFDDWDFVNSL